MLKQKSVETGYHRLNQKPSKVYLYLLSLKNDKTNIIIQVNVSIRPSIMDQIQPLFINAMSMSIFTDMIQILRWLRNVAIIVGRKKRTIMTNSVGPGCNGFNRLISLTQFNLRIDRPKLFRFRFLSFILTLTAADWSFYRKAFLTLLLSAYGILPESHQEWPSEQHSRFPFWSDGCLYSFL